MTPVTERVSDTKKILNKRNKIYIGLLAASFGAGLFALGYYLNHSTENKLLGDILEKVGEFSLLVVSLHFMYEWLVKDFDREEYIESLKLVLRPQSDLLSEANQTLNSLFVQTQSVLNLVGYSDIGSFEVKWKSMAEHYDKFLLIGNIPVGYLNHIPGTGTKRKTISVFRTVNDRNRGQILEAMQMFQDNDIREVKAYHIGRFDWGFTIIASNQQGNEVEALINYNSNPEDEPTGYYVFGNTAVALRNSIRSRLKSDDTEPDIPQDESDSAVPIESEVMLDYLLSNRILYNSLINEIRQGIPLQGEEAICQRMSYILANTKWTLDVTHIARGESIKLLDNPSFKAWLRDNYSAADNEVKIKRIFLVQKNEINDPILQKCMTDLSSHPNIEVKYCFLEDIPQALCKDFSIYDGKDLVFISPTTGGAWKEERIEARHSCNQARIERYKGIFKQLDGGSKSFR